MALSNTQLAVLMILTVWDMAWKGLGMWKAGRRNEKAWFVCILIFNTAGILPIIYLTFFGKKK